MRSSLLLAALLAALGAPAGAAEPWEAAIAGALGKAGTEMPGGVYRVGLPRSDLQVSLGGVAIKPGLALGSWLAFARNGHGTMVMGDLVLTDAEVNPVMKRLADGGIAITALHNHLLGAAPHTMYMHVMGEGDGARLAATLHAALALSGTPLAAPPPAEKPAPIDLDTRAIDQAIGHQGKANGAIYAFSIPRAETVRAGGMIVPEAMGSAIAINFQPLGAGRAAIAGDLVLAADELNPVLRALQANGIEIEAIHNHMLDDQPRLFFMHFWAVDDAVKLARGMGAALAKVRMAR